MKPGDIKRANWEDLLVLAVEERWGLLQSDKYDRLFLAHECMISTDPYDSFDGIFTHGCGEDYCGNCRALIPEKLKALGRLMDL